MARADRPVIGWAHRGWGVDWPCPNSLVGKKQNEAAPREVRNGERLDCRFGNPGARVTKARQPPLVSARRPHAVRIPPNGPRGAETFPRTMALRLCSTIVRTAMSLCQRLPCVSTGRSLPGIHASRKLGCRFDASSQHVSCSWRGLRDDVIIRWQTYPLLPASQISRYPLVEPLI